MNEYINKIENNDIVNKNNENDNNIYINDVYYFHRLFKFIVNTKLFFKYNLYIQLVI